MITSLKEIRLHRALVGCFVLAIFLSTMGGCFGRSKPGSASSETMAEEKVAAELPAIGATITTDRALELCRYYGLGQVYDRIEGNPNRYEQWVFDGCSMMPDALLSKLIDVPSLTEICLRHDLEYAYGDPGNEGDRLSADRRFRDELLDGGAGKLTAATMYSMVRVFGKEECRFSFSWAFAVKR